MTNDERLHYLAGFAKGLRMWFLPRRKAWDAILDLDLFAYNREWAQNLAGANPNNPMSPHQIAEAKAWGLGARAARRLDPPFPVPPYPA